MYYPADSLKAKLCAEGNRLIHEFSVLALAVGFLASAVCGFLAIKYLLRYVARHDFKIFVWYRIALALLIPIILYFCAK